MKYRCLKNTFLLILLLSLPQLSRAQATVVSASIERDTIWLGDQFKLILLAEIPAGGAVQFPLPVDSLSNGVEVISASPIDSSKLKNGMLQLRQTYVITAFDSGPRRIEPFAFALTQGGQTDTIKTNSLSFFVAYPPVDLKQGPADIKKPYEAPVTFKEIAPWLFGFILLGCIVFLILYLISRYRKNMPIFQAPPKPKVPAYVVALEELEKLKGDELWQHDKVKEHYTRLTDILRQYIEEQFGVPAMEQTTPEIMVSLNEGHLKQDASLLDNLKKTLEISDLVKFAKFSPLPDENHYTLKQAIQFVEMTKPQVIESVVKTEVVTDLKSNEQMEEGK